MHAAPALRAIGHAAHAALAASGGRLDAADSIAIAPYARAGGEWIWIGHGDVAMHPRAVVLAEAVRVTTVDRLAAGALTPWRPPRLPRGSDVREALRSGCAVLARNRPKLASPAGFAALLDGAAPAFPLARAEAHVRAFASALARDDRAAIRAAAWPLLGLGPGLTPSGDDLVGGALFARRLQAATTREIDAADGLAAQLIADARERTHPIAAALFADLATAQTFASLHRLAHAMVAHEGDDAIVAAARETVAIGHSSGSEMLAGVILGVDPGTLARQRQETR
jgi:hypothetical protein